MRMSKIKGILVVIIAAAALFNPGTVVKAGDGAAAQNEEPARGILVTLSVYSGRPNPDWWLTAEDQMKEIADLIWTLKAVPDAKLFDYDKWNRLGYASFWINPKGIDKVPFAVHVWRDMAFMVLDRKGEKVMYSLGATKLYDVLVAQAERKGYKEFFIKYHRDKEKMPTR
jgi:hypothetical protein